MLYSPIGEKVYVTQWFAERPHVYAPLLGHPGIDFRAKFSDTPLGHRYVYAAAEGVIESATWGKGYGNRIELRVSSGLFKGWLFGYSHLSKYKAKKGQTVKGAKVIGITGNTGDSSGPHLDFDMIPPNPDIRNGYAGRIDPMIHMKDGMIDPETGKSMIWKGRIMEYAPTDSYQRLYLNEKRLRIDLEKRLERIKELAS